jgi:hypothetical protein
MSEAAMEIAPLHSRIPVQLQAEAQQKQCDYILFSTIAVKHNSGGGFGRFMKMAGQKASLAPMAGMGRGMGALSLPRPQGRQLQLSGLNGQIKSKDEVTIQYQLVATEQSTPILQNTLTAKAKSDGEDVLTPLLQQTATTVLTQVVKRQELGAREWDSHPALGLFFGSASALTKMRVRLPYLQFVQSWETVSETLKSVRKIFTSKQL